MLGFSTDSNYRHHLGAKTYILLMDNDTLLITQGGIPASDSIISRSYDNLTTFHAQNKLEMFYFDICIELLCSSLKVISPFLEIKSLKAFDNTFLLLFSEPPTFKDRIN